MRALIFLIVALTSVQLVMTRAPQDDAPTRATNVAIENNAQPAATHQVRHPLWVIESGKNRIYLLGSIHVLRDQDYPLPDAFRRAYEDAEHLVMELDFTDLDPLATLATTRRLAMLPETETLRSIIGEAHFLRAQDAARSAGIDLEQFARVDPWYAAMTITQLQLKRLGYKAENGIELHFASLAKRDDKKGSGLETLDEQLGILDALPTESQTRFLLESLADTDELRAEGERMIAAWKAGDSKRLYDLFAEDLAKNPELREALLVERNRRWLPRIIELTAKSDDYLVIVGALHLVGEDGVIELLRERGLSVRQL